MIENGRTSKKKKKEGKGNINSKAPRNVWRARVKIVFLFLVKKYFDNLSCFKKSKFGYLKKTNILYKYKLKYLIIFYII